MLVNVPDSALSHKIPIHTFASNQNKNYYGKGNEGYIEHLFNSIGHEEVNKRALLPCYYANKT